VLEAMPRMLDLFYVRDLPWVMVAYWRPRGVYIIRACLIVYSAWSWRLLDIAWAHRETGFGGYFV
jgi:hypothetical protein